MNNRHWLGSHFGYLENLFAGRARRAGAGQRRDGAGHGYAIKRGSPLGVRRIYEDRPAPVGGYSGNREPAIIVRGCFVAVWVAAIDHLRAFDRRAALLNSHDAGERDERLALADKYGGWAASGEIDVMEFFGNTKNYSTHIYITNSTLESTKPVPVNQSGGNAGDIVPLVVNYSFHGILGVVTSPGGESTFGYCLGQGNCNFLNPPNRTTAYPNGLGDQCTAFDDPSVVDEV